MYGLFYYFCALDVKNRIIQVCHPLLQHDKFGDFPIRFSLSPNVKIMKRIKNLMLNLMAIPKKNFADWFENWKARWDKYVRSQAEYCKED